MDKFGIFNILNSFLGAINEKNGQVKDNSSTTPDYLNAISSFFNKENSSLNNAVSPTKEEKRGEKEKLPPLQSSMLDVMKSHDNFVNRVLFERNKKR